MTPRAILELAEPGPVAADELGRRNARREDVLQLVGEGLATVDPSTGDLELTEAGRAVLQQEATPYP